MSSPSEDPATTATNSDSPEKREIAFCALTLDSMRLPSMNTWNEVVLLRSFLFPAQSASDSPLALADSLSP